MKVIMATNNADKVREIREILNDPEIQIVSLKDAGIEINVEETGTTFEENALLKARAVRDLTGCVTAADDSGLEIDYFDKAPGIYSSRFMGEDTPYEEKNTAILERMKDVPDEKRSARFICAVAVCRPDGIEKTFRGVMEGRIARQIAGEGGFGYDPIFFLPDRGCTSAQLTENEKNAISHRGKAFRQAAQELKAQT